MNQAANVTSDELLRLFDGELSPSEARRVQARLNDEDRVTLATWQNQKEQLKALGQSIAAEPVPHDLQKAVEHTDSAHAHMRQWQRWGGMAAGVVLAFGMGWFTRSLGWDEQGSSLASSQPQSVRLATHSFQGQAALAHATFTPEVKHPVEVSAEQQAHLVQWLSKRLGRELQLPNLSTQGYELMGGRLLPGDAGARAQFMFQRSDGTRVTLYVGALNETEHGASPQETAFSFSQRDQVASFYWVDRGFGYALSALLPKAELLALAQAVYRLL